MIAHYISDGGGNRVKASVTKNGQLVVGPYAYDEVSSQSLATDNVAVNFFGPKAGFQFVLTTILLNAKKTVTTDGLVEIYEATSSTSAVVAKSILAIEMLTNSVRDITGLNLLVSEGVYINGKTDDNVVNGTLMGYYIPVID